MYTAEVRFKLGRRDQREQQIDAIGCLIPSWRSNGQIGSIDWVTAVHGPRYSAFVKVLELDSLSDAHANKWVRQDLSKLLDTGASPPEVKILGQPEEPELVCSCAERPTLILFTHFLGPESPVRCGGCYGLVPLYRLPKTDPHDGYSDIFSWESSYQACDTLQMGCEVGERFGTRQMEDWESPLTKQGRAVCTRIEEVTGTPTYYYLHKYAGRSERKERERRCPGCGGEWLLDEPWHRLYNFRCEPCRLLSTLAVSLTR